ETRQRLRSGTARHQSQTRLGQTELRALARHDEIAQQRQLEAAAERVALDHRDHRLGDLRQRAEHPVDLARALAPAPELVDLPRLHLLLAGVDARAEGLLAALEDDAAHGLGAV